MQTASSLATTHDGIVIAAFSVPAARGFVSRLDAILTNLCRRPPREEKLRLQTGLANPKLVMMTMKLCKTLNLHTSTLQKRLR